MGDAVKVASWLLKNGRVAGCSIERAPEENLPEPFVLFEE
jgi:hypothetical protein